MSIYLPFTDNVSMRVVGIEGTHLLIVFNDDLFPNLNLDPLKLDVTTEIDLLVSKEHLQDIHKAYREMDQETLAYYSLMYSK